MKTNAATASVEHIGEEKPTPSLVEMPRHGTKGSGSQRGEADKVVANAEARIEQLTSMLTALQASTTDLSAPLSSSHAKAASSSMPLHEVGAAGGLLSLEAADEGSGSRWHFSTELDLPYEARAVDGKGLGLFATRDIHEGERLIAEVPLARWLMPKDASQQVRRRSFEQLIAEFTPAQRAGFLALSHSTHHGDASGGRTMMGTWLTNALPINYEDGYGNDETHDEGAVFAVISRINHSCVPNCHHEWNPALGRETIHAIAPIAAGTELTISYLMPAGRPCTERQERLQAQFGFTCDCALCGLCGDAQQRSDACQRAIGELTPEAGAPLPAMLSRLEVRLSLMRREGMPGVWARPLLNHAMVASVQDKSPAGKARSAELAERARAACLTSTGPDHPNYKIIQSFLAIVGQFDKAAADLGTLAGAGSRIGSGGAAGGGGRKGK